MIDKVGTASSVGDGISRRAVGLSPSPRAASAYSVSMMPHSPHFPRNSARESLNAPRCSESRAPALPTSGTPDSSPEFHAIVILFARDVAERDRCEREHAAYLAKIGGVRVLSSLNLEALPPYGEPREHFGYLDRLTHPAIEGMNDTPTPGSIPAVKPGEFFLGYIDESGGTPALPKPEELTKNGSYLAYLRMQEHVGAFRDFLRTQGGPTPEEQEFMAATS